MRQRRGRAIRSETASWPQECRSRSPTSNKRARGATARTRCSREGRRQRLQRPGTSVTTLTADAVPDPVSLGVLHNRRVVTTERGASPLEAGAANHRSSARPRRPLRMRVSQAVSQPRRQTPQRAGIGQHLWRTFFLLSDTGRHCAERGKTVRAFLGVKGPWVQIPPARPGQRHCDHLAQMQVGHSAVTSEQRARWKGRQWRPCGATRSGQMCALATRPGGGSRKGLARRWTRASRKGLARRSTRASSCTRQRTRRARVMLHRDRISHPQSSNRSCSVPTT